jgi:hypothetical protein
MRLIDADMITLVGAEILRTSEKMDIGSIGFSREDPKWILNVGEGNTCRA